MVKLRQHAETCKHVLSTLTTAQVFIESLMDGIDWNQNVTRARFENVIAAKIPLFVRPIEEFVKKHSSIVVDKVSTAIDSLSYSSKLFTNLLFFIAIAMQIIFTGGTMKIPKLQQAISALFPTAQVLNTIPPDEVVAIGCGKQALHITGVSWDTNGEHIEKEVETLGQDVYVEYVADVKNGENANARQILFGRGSLVPSVNKMTITRPIKCVDGKAKIRIIQGDKIEDIERECSADLKEIRARIHHSDDTTTPSIHIHLD